MNLTLRRIVFYYDDDAYLNINTIKTNNSRNFYKYAIFLIN